MTATAIGSAVAAPVPGRFVSANRIGNFALGLVVFLGAFVVFEPAPYELLLVGLVVAWAMAGLRISRYILPLIILLLCYVVGGTLSLGQLDDLSEPLLYLATTLLLAVSAMFFAAVIPGDPERRLNTIIRAYTAAAIAAAILGIVGYFAGIELFTLYERARGPFQDPNVFGPFLMLAFAYLVYQVFTRGLWNARWQALGSLILMLAIALSFSRAAWGMAALVLLVTVTLAYINQRSGPVRVRQIAYVGLAVILLVALAAILLNLPATSSLFLDRAQFVQNYDAGELGRFDRQQLGFMLAFERPFGIGPLEFGNLFGADEHNMWLKGFMVYGWLGGFAYIALVVWTLIISFPLLFKRRPWQGIVVCAFAVFLGQLLIHNVIDNDHWRHLYLIYGVLWGVYATERLQQRRERLALPVYRAALERAPVPA